MSNSNLPIGTANDRLAPWNQEETVVNIDLKRDVYTECCGCDDYAEIDGETICCDCGNQCSIYNESDADYEKRLSIEEEKEIIKIQSGYYSE